MNAPFPMPQRGLVAVAKERPFDGRLHVLPFEADKRLSIEDVLASIPDLPDDFADHCEARINGEIVPRHLWRNVYPRKNPFIDVAVTFTLPMRGGGGGGGGQKSTLSTIASIVVLLAAAAVSGGALGLGGVGFLSAGAVNAVAGAGVGIAGALAIAALTPPPRATANTTDATAGSAPQALPASLTGNVLSPGAAIPRAIGTMRVFPPLACPPLVELVGDLEYAETVLVLSGPHALSDLRVGNVKSADIAELDIELQEGLAASPKQSLVPRYGATATPNIEVVGHLTDQVVQYRLANQTDPDLASPQWFSVVSRDSPDEVWLNLGWPEGLFKSDTPTAAILLPVRFRFRQRGSSTWVNCPEIHFHYNGPTPFQKVVRFKWGAMPAAPNLPPTTRGPIAAYKTVPGQTVPTPTTAGWSADSYFSAGGGNDLLQQSTLATSSVLNTELYQDKVIFYLDSATFPQGTYEFQVMRAVPFEATANWQPANYYYTVALPSSGRPGVVSTTVYDFFKYASASGFYVTFTDPSAFHARIILTRVASVWNKNPIQSNDFATISLRVHSRALEQVSVLASGYVRDWDGSAWANITTTANPAAHFHDVLTGTLGASPLPVSMVDSAALVAWRTACTALGYTCNAVLEGKSYLDALNLIASTGYARLLHNETWGVFRDKNRAADTPVQIFTPRNMSGFSWTKAFAKRPSGIRAGFVSAALDYVPDEVIVYDNPDNPDGSSLEQITYDGLTVAADVSVRAHFDLTQADKRLTFYSGSVDWESLVCTRGDLVGVQHDIIADKAGFARITAVTTLAGNVTGLTLEGTVPVASVDAWSAAASAWSSYSSAWSAARTGVAIRLKGGNGILTKEISGASDEVSTVTFVTPFADPGTSQLDVDCLCAVGPLGTEYRRLIVFAIQPADQLNAKITFVDEAPELWAA